MESYELKLKQNLKSLLERNGIRASDLAKQTGIARQVISDWMSGTNPRNLEQVKRVASYFNQSLDELCFDPCECVEAVSNMDEIEGIFEIKMKRITPSPKSDITS